MSQYKIHITGMTCSACENHIEKAIDGTGVVNSKADYTTGEVLFELPDDYPIENVIQAIKDTNYHPGEIVNIFDQKSAVPVNKEDYDLLIIGSGGAAFSAAIKAVGYGATVGMVERGTVGGTCVNTGCVPSKTLLKAGEINRTAYTNPFEGLHTSAREVDLNQLVNQKNHLVSDLRNQKYIDLIDEYGIDLIKGEAKFINENTIDVNGKSLSAQHFLIATGASPLIPDIQGIDEVDYLTSTTLLELRKLPKRLTIIGSGYIGRELGQLFHNLGTEVTLIQRSKRLLKDYDPEISESMENSLSEQGIHIISSATYERIEQDKETIKVYISVDGKKQMIESEQLLVGTGRKPNTEALCLSAAKVEVGSLNEIKINAFAQTSNEQIYAAGDVTLGPQFVYVAAYEGGLAADNAIGGLNKKIDLTVVPAVTFTHPGFASVGLTEKKAESKGYEVKTSLLSLSAVPRAIVNHDTSGVIKLVADKQTRKILGVHAVAENAGEIIYAATLAVKFGLTIDDLKDTFAPYLTMSEGLKLAALAFDTNVSKLSCCAG